MGWDINSVGKHSFDTSSLEILARQLSDTFDINIDYGHSNVVKYNETKHQVDYVDDYTFEKIGEVLKSKKCKVYQLCDDHFNEKAIYEIFGGNLNNVVYQQIDNEDKFDFFKFLVKEGFDFLDSKKELYNLSISIKHKKKINNYEFKRCFIYNDVISITIEEPFRWFGFVNQLKENAEYFDDFVNYRQSMAKLYQKAGSEQVVYFPDQGVTELILDMMFSTNCSWNDLLNYIITKAYYSDYIQIDFQEESYRKLALKEFKQKDKALHVSISDFFLNDKPFFKLKDNLEVLFDDFKDLKNMSV